MRTNDLYQKFISYMEYCRYFRQLRPSTLNNYTSQLGVFFTLMPEVTNANDLSISLVLDFFKRLEERKRMIGKGKVVSGVKKSTIESYWNRLNPFFEWLVAKGELKENPLKLLPKPRPEYSDRLKLSKRDIEKILSAITLYAQNQLVQKRDIAMVFILLFCGLRKSELLGLQVRDIDLSKRILTVRGETSKSKKTRKLPLNHTLAIALEDYLDIRRRKGYKTEFVFVSSVRDHGLTQHGLKHWVKRISQNSGVRFHIHQFRHTFACGLGSLNASGVKIQKLMGHTDLRMTQRYLRSMGVEDLRDEVNLLNIETLT